MEFLDPMPALRAQYEADVEALRHLRQHCLGRGLLGKIAREERALEAIGGRGAGDADDMMTAGRQPVGDGASDALAGAGDEGCLGFHDALTRCRERQAR